MPKPLSAQQVTRLAEQHGIDPGTARVLGKLSQRESGGRYWVNNAGTNKNGTVDHGLLQINDIWAKDPDIQRIGWQNRYDPAANIEMAKVVLRKQGLKAWATYNPSIDKQYIGSGKQAKTETPASYTQAGNTGVDKTALALSLLGEGDPTTSLLSNISSSYGVDPLQLAITAALQKHATSIPSRETTASAPSSQPQGHPSGKTVYMDGKPVVGWIAQILQKAKRAGWHGTVTSGVRTKAEQLQAAKNYGLQHYPNGPLASNHVEGHNGAVDVSDPEGLKRALQKLGINRLRNDMPEDPVHFSATGH